MIQDVLLLLTIICCALVPWALPQPSRWPSWLASHLATRRAARRRSQPAVRYVYVRRVRRAH